MIDNQQLFSEAYLREVNDAKRDLDRLHASRQTILEWREEFPILSDPITCSTYVGQVLSTLGVTYAPLEEENGFYLFADSGQQEVTGICLIVQDDALGRTTKGRHHQARTIQRLRQSKLNWGILTNGRKWRLCHAAASAPYEVFLEADLDALIQSRDLPRFSLFHHCFGGSAFGFGSSVSASSAAQGGISAERSLGLDNFLHASDKRTEAVERHLKSRIESLLQSLCLGFVADEAAGEYSRETLDAIYQNGIYLLYRLLFLFYAEARHLLPIGEPQYQSASLAALVMDAQQSQLSGSFADDPYQFWKRLTHLFVVVDDGDDTLGVAAYNGGLFSDEEKPYLKKHKITNDYLAPALFALGFESTKTGHQPINYRDLSVRHLGTLYEGLLEYRLNLVQQEPVVVRESGGKRQFIPQSLAGDIKKGETILEVGQVYFADDKGERKSSGSYYTPEDVVQYIVSNTVTPKLLECRAALDAFLQDVRQEYAVAATETQREQVASFGDQRTVEVVQKDILGLRVLDPAMGSGHFLVAACQAITNFIVETLNATDWANDALSTEPLLWKRRVVERCLYGVDKNPLAQELAKLALWISSASTGKPLTFLDHHLKCGNSLYGTPLSRLAVLPTSKLGKDKSLLGDLREQIVQELAAQTRQITSVDSERIRDVKHKGELNRAAKALTCRLTDIANVWLATLFDLKVDDGKPLGDDHYNYLLDMVNQNRSADSWETVVSGNRILRDAREIARREEFFHWELEFPDSVLDGECKFDAVIANPPYVGMKANKAITALYETAKCGDLYAWIMEKALNVTNGYGNMGTIVPLSLMFSRQLSSIRNLITKRTGDAHFANFDNNGPNSIFSVNDSPNSQRATIALLQDDKSPLHIYSTDLFRWSREDRPQLLKSLKYADVTHATNDMGFPKIGDSRLGLFWEGFQASPSTLKDLCVTILGESQKAYDAEYFLIVPRAIRYFLSAIPIQIDRNKVLTLTFNNQHNRDLAMLILNSNVHYWYWLMFGDGFVTNVEIISRFPVPNVPAEEVKGMADYFLSIVDECKSGFASNGQVIPNYNFNKRMDILLDIDEWTVKHVAPDLNLPRDIFAQYKSNSFLRPLDLSAITSSVAELEGEE